MGSGPEWFIVAFIALWLAMCAFMSVVGGWHLLARSFAGEAPAEGERLGFCRGSLGYGQVPVGYGRMLLVGVGEKGFSLSVFFLFRFMHPPLFIPWSSVERCEPVRHWLSERIAVRLPGFNPTILLDRDAGRRILAEWSRASGRREPTSPA